MNVSLTPELEEFVNEKVASGLYPSATDVVRESLRLLRERDELNVRKLQDLRAALAVGIEQAEQGKTTPFTEELIEDTKARGRSRRAQKGMLPT